MVADLSDIVVFKDPDGNPFSMDPRWQDSKVRDAWIKQDEAAPAPEEDEEEDVPYSEWTNDELRAELQSRGLELDGKKTALIERLEKDDEKGA